MALQEVAITFTGPSSPMISRLYFSGSGGTAQQAATAVSTFMATMDDYMNNLYAWAIDDEVRHLDEVTGDLTGITSITTSGATGASAGEPIDLLQYCLTWRTADIENSRLVKGRTFFPGADESRNETPGRPTTALTAIVNTAATALIATATAELVVWHRPVYSGPPGGRVLTRDGSAHIVTTGTLNTQWAYLTSRRR